MERTALSKTTDRLSSVSLLMSMKSNSGAADARATVTGPSAEVAAWLNPRTDIQTDRQTDRRHAVARLRFALCASHGKNYIFVNHIKFIVLKS